MCACVLLIGAGLYLTRNNKQETQESSDSAFVPDLDPDASTQEAKESDPPEGIRIPGYPSITIPADTKDVTVNLMNPEGNPCYFTFTLVLKDTDETIYQSKMVEPGKAITQITLSKELSAGEYPAILKISTAAMDDGRAIDERCQCGNRIESTVRGEKHEEKKSSCRRVTACLRDRTERISRNHDRNVSCGSVLYGAGSGKHHDSI